ncbi:hypothetical protein MMC18_004431 [Xylographa bjoerkii]|nr:hypothetical protein [Xylographa bjoerkii]
MHEIGGREQVEVSLALREMALELILYPYLSFHVLLLLPPYTLSILEILSPLIRRVVCDFFMGDPFTTLHAKERPSFVWSDGFEGATDVELKILLQSIEAEFESRMILKNSRQACKIDVYGDRLREGANKIGIQERLDEKHAEHVNAAVSILTTSQIVRAFMVYKAFLDDVLYHCGPELVLLCAACLGKAKVAALKKEDRISLLDLVKRKKSTYISPVLGRLATEYGIRTLHDKQETKRKRAEGTNLASAGIMSELTPMGATGEGGYTTGSNRFSGV